MEPDKKTEFDEAINNYIKEYGTSEIDLETIEKIKKVLLELAEEDKE